METTIQITKELRKVLENRKTNVKESYENVIWDLLEDNVELSEQTKREIEKSRREIRQGKFKSLAQVKRELGL